MRPTRTSAFLAQCLFLSIASVCSAQSVNNAVNTGTPENGVFHGSDVEHVQVNNGNLRIDIPIYSIKGRGLDTSAHFIYDNKGWTFNTNCDISGDCWDQILAETNNTMILAASGPANYILSYKTPRFTCSLDHVSVIETSNMVVREPNGTKHHFSPDPITDTANRCISTATTVYADDGAGWILQKGANGWTATDKHGTALPFSWFSSPATVEDTNGNELLTSNSTDTLGRQVNTTSYYDSSGTQRSFVTATTTVAIQTNLCPFVLTLTQSTERWWRDCLYNAPIRCANQLHVRYRGQWWPRGDESQSHSERCFVHLELCLQHINGSWGRHNFHSID